MLTGEEMTPSRGATDGEGVRRVGPFSGSCGWSLRRRRDSPGRPSFAPGRERRQRQTMKNMTKPLKQWLYEHKDSPYPSKAEKFRLSIDSNMTLIQVNNWFANARRRLKNTVRDPHLSWEQRIHKYNNNVTGSADQLSVSTNDASSGMCDEFDADDDISTVNYAQDREQNVVNEYNPTCTNGDVNVAEASQQRFSNVIPNNAQQVHKYKSSIMQRYLNDSYEHAHKFRAGLQCEVNRVTHLAEASRSHCNGGDGGIYGTAPCGELGSEHTHEAEEENRPTMSGGHRCQSSTQPMAIPSSNLLTHRHRHSSEDYSHASTSSDDCASYLQEASITGFSPDDGGAQWEEVLAAIALTNMARSRHQGK